MPDFAISLPLGAGRLTREHLRDGGPASDETLRTRAPSRAAPAEGRGGADPLGGPLTAAATSRTFTQLARLCGAPPGRHGPFVRRELTRRALGCAVTELAAPPAARRAEPPGISARARPSRRGALVGHTAMKLMGIRELTISPWAIREGILLRRIEGDTAWWSGHPQPTDRRPAAQRAALRLAAPR
ncbi:hypothetical protein [Streptomyces sp. KL116D]|uniref:Ppx/GppA phosphatase family protein n=1 Tax=Streptomyces sp. KL116D TaxID=3045152 RepID=UPI003555CCBE